MSFKSIERTSRRRLTNTYWGFDGRAQRDDPARFKVGFNASISQATMKAFEVSAFSYAGFLLHGPCKPIPIAPVDTAHIATSPRGCSICANSATLAGMKTEALRPTLEQLRRSTPWCWVVCEYCMHRRPVAFMPFTIRWGPDASSNRLRRSARYTQCGRKGAALRHPSWAGIHIGWELPST
jgi:hypothetical protein